MTEDQSYKQLKLLSSHHPEGKHSLAYVMFVCASIGQCDYLQVVIPRGVIDLE